MRRGTIGIRRALAPMMNRWLSLGVLLFFSASTVAQNAQSRIEQARQFRTIPQNEELLAPSSAATPFDTFDETRSDDAFGAQVILKQAEQIKRFTGFAQLAAFVTNNVALAARGRQNDRFLIASAGASLTERLSPSLRLEAGVSASAYRYDEFRSLDFQSTDVFVGATWSPRVLSGVDLTARYIFSELTTTSSDKFYDNHAGLVGGVQSVPDLARAGCLHRSERAVGLGGSARNATQRVPRFRRRSRADDPAHRSGSFLSPRGVFVSGRPPRSESRSLVVGPLRALLVGFFLGVELCLEEQL